MPLAEIVAPTTPASVLLVDDHALLRTGVANIINQEADLQVVAEAGNGVEALEAYDKFRPDVTLLDLRMPVMEGVEVVRRLRERDPRARVIVLTTYDTDEEISRALKAGAKAYVLKDISADDLVTCIRDVLAGKTYLAPAAAAKLAEEVTRVQLTPRELATLRLMADGKSNKEIANELGISDRTVKTHLGHLFEKLGVTSRTEAVKIATPRGLVRLEYLSPLVSELHHRLLIDHQRLDELMRCACARHVDAHGKHAGRLALEVDDILRRRYRDGPLRALHVNSHLRAGAEHRDGVAVEPKPVGMRDHGVHGLAHGRLHDPRLDPGVDTAPYVVTTQPLTAVGQHQLPDRLGRPRDLDPVDPARARGPRVEWVLLAVRADHSHPAVQGVESVPGDGDRVLGRAESRLEQPAEVRQVSRPPRRLLLGRPGTGGVDRPQRVGHDGPPHRRRAPPALAVRGEDQSVLLLARHAAHRARSVAAHARTVLPGSLGWLAERLKWRFVEPMTG
jgi:two-component system NarL family response regulator